MNEIAEATLKDGTKIPYVVTDSPPRGGMKHTYFAPDRSYVVQFYNKPQVGEDPHVRSRLEAIIGRYNPTRSEETGGAIGNSEQIAAYFAEQFCWPTAIVESPQFGIVCPTYPEKFFFSEKSSSYVNLKGKDKRSNWFTSKNRAYLALNELGDFRSMLRMSILLARSVRRMHQAGLAHSDLSNNNVLIDPVTGSCVVIDIDSLVVPGLFPPEVIGTRGYIAPEILSTLGLPRHDPRRKSSSTYTDMHALAVLIYEYLFFRHPLIGPKIYCAESAAKDDYLMLGPGATFIEDPADQSNRPHDLKAVIQDLGPVLEKLFLRAFVEGLRDPHGRPTAMEWERGLVKTWELLQPCSNPYCQAKWFVFYDLRRSRCPFCNRETPPEEVLRLRLLSELRGQPGQWVELSEVNAYHNQPLFLWHFFSNIFAGEKADQTMQAFICKHQGHWFLVNSHVPGLISPGGYLIPPGKGVPLQDGDMFRASAKEQGFLIEVTNAAKMRKI